MKFFSKHNLKCMVYLILALVFFVWGLSILFSEKIGWIFGLGLIVIGIICSIIYGIKYKAPDSVIKS